jgi:hypothetical protein
VRVDERLLDTWVVGDDEVDMLEASLRVWVDVLLLGPWAVGVRAWIRLERVLHHAGNDEMVVFGVTVNVRLHVRLLDTWVVGNDEAVVLGFTHTVLVLVDTVVVVLPIHTVVVLPPTHTVVFDVVSTKGATAEMFEWVFGFVVATVDCEILVW